MPLPKLSRARPIVLAGLLLAAAIGPAAAQGWDGIIDREPLPPIDLPDSGPVEDPDSAPQIAPGVPNIIETPPPGQPPAAGQAAPSALPPGRSTVGPEGDIEIVQPPAQKIVNKTAVFSGLDKITGRIITFDVAINETVQFGALRITPRACYTRPATETQNTVGFVEVQEIELDGGVKPLFGGWMFAASPGLHGIEHPIYDAWLIDCKQSAPEVASPGGQQ